MADIDIALLEDINACASEALTALQENRTDDAIRDLKGLLDLVRETIGAHEG